MASVPPSPLMAIAMSRGVWPGDVSFLMRRCRRQNVKAPTQPPPMDVALYMKPELEELRASALVMEEELQPEYSCRHERKYSCGVCHKDVGQSVQRGRKR